MSLTAAAGRRITAVRQWGAVLCAALFLSWPAFYNGYPLLFSDSMSYLEGGLPVAKALFRHQFTGEYDQRSLIYCLGILPLHWNLNAWPVVAMNGVATAYVLWLVARSLRLS